MIGYQEYDEGQLLTDYKQRISQPVDIYIYIFPIFVVKLLFKSIK